jgi:hypothetical protein
MRRFAVLFLLLLVVCFGGAASASADTVQLLKVGDEIPAIGFAGPYQATLNGSSITMVCMSFDRNVALGQTWEVTVNELTAEGVANSLYGDQDDALFRYQQIAFLTDQLALHPDASGDIQVAIWNIFNTDTPDTAGSAAWLALAGSQDFTGYDFSNFRILTPTDRSSAGPQENIVTVPEPTTMLLLGTGLAAIGAKFRKRRRTLEQ